MEWQQKLSFPLLFNLMIGKGCPIFIALFLVFSPSFFTYADKFNENDDIPLWADGFFHGFLKINGENSGGVEGYISLKRNDMSGNISGIWKNGENEVPFKGIFYHNILICFSSFPFPIFGFVDFNDTNFNAYLWYFGKKMQAYGIYDASMLPLPEGNYSIGLEVKHLIDESDEALQNFWEVLKGDTYRASILGSAHQDFTDLPLLFPHFMPNIPRSVIPGFGSIDGKMLIKIVNTFTLAFFDVYLNEKPRDELLSLEDEFDEVIFDYK